MSAQDVLRKAAGEIGYYAPADPQPGSKYGRWLAEKFKQPWLAGPSTKIWWCVIFGAWVYDGLATVPGLPGYNTDVVLGMAKVRGALLQDPRQAQPGDVVIFDWNKTNAATDHFGIVEINAGTHLQTIEGNTSGSDGPRQSNGNGVWRRTRGWDTVAGVIRPIYLESETIAPSLPVATPVVSQPKPQPVLQAPPFPLPQGYYFGPRLPLSNKKSVSGFYSHKADLKRWQQRMKDRGWNITVDGEYGDNTGDVAEAFQREKGLGVDRLIGSQTWSAAWTAPVTG